MSISRRSLLASVVALVCKPVEVLAAPTGVTELAGAMPTGTDCCPLFDYGENMSHVVFVEETTYGASPGGGWIKLRAGGVDYAVPYWSE